MCHVYNFYLFYAFPPLFSHSPANCPWTPPNEWAATICILSPTLCRSELYTKKQPAEIIVAWVLHQHKWRCFTKNLLLPYSCFTYERKWATHVRKSKDSQYLMIKVKFQDKKNITLNEFEWLFFWFQKVYITGAWQYTLYFSCSVVYCWHIRSKSSSKITVKYNK